MINFVKEVYHIWVTERPGQHAAALAFFGIFSFAPVIFIAFSIVGLFADSIAAANYFYQRLVSIFGEEVAMQIQNYSMNLPDTSSGHSILISIISLGSMLFAASGVFFQLQFSMNAIWLVPLQQKSPFRSMIRKQLFSFLIVIGIGLLWTLSILANMILAWFGSVVERLLRINPSQSFAAGASAFLLAVVAFVLLYKILPETKVAWRDVWLGALVAALLILAATLIAGLFFKYSSFSSALQVAGDFSVLLLGIFYFAQIFLLGAVICRVYADQFGSRRPALSGQEP